MLSTFVPGNFSRDIHSHPVSRRCSHCCDRHQGLGPGSHYPPDVPCCQDRAGEFSWTNWRYVCWSTLQLDISSLRPDLCVRRLLTHKQYQSASSDQTWAELVQWPSQTRASEQAANVDSSLAQESSLCDKLAFARISCFLFSRWHINDHSSAIKTKLLFLLNCFHV